MDINQADYSLRLRQLMQPVGINSYRALSQQAGVSRWGINLLRQGQVDRLRVGMLMRLSSALEISVSELITQFTEPARRGPEAALQPGTTIETGAPAADILQQEYERLKQQMVKQEQEIRLKVQEDAISLLESWLLQWPTAVYAVQQNNNLPAARLLPLTKPLDSLLLSWNLLPIGRVGEQVPFNPQLHQPMNDNPQPGQTVRVRYVGYCHGERLLYRAKVSPLD